MDFVLILVLVIVVVAIVAGPLRQRAHAPEGVRELARRADLEAAREAKYAEIRDAELDRRTGKLSDADFRALDRQLRAEAIEIMRALDELGELQAPS
jgi:type II secretory pathway component PulM